MNEPIRPELVRRYADAIMVAIQADMDAGIVPRSVSTFTELHDYVDANEYAVLADVPWGSDPEALKYDNSGYALVNAVEGAVSAMLAVSARQTTPSAAPAKPHVRRSPQGLCGCGTSYWTCPARGRDKWFGNMKVESDGGMQAPSLGRMPAPPAPW
jgi:hypothetical protein